MGWPVYMGSPAGGHTSDACRTSSSQETRYPACVGQSNPTQEACKEARHATPTPSIVVAHSTGAIIVTGGGPFT